MEFQELITFVTITKCGSFSKASEQLGYSQSAVTVQIKNLENELQVRLFDRLGKSISLTSHGQIFYDHALQVLNDIQAAKDSFNQGEELCGLLRIGTIDSLCATILPDILKEYHLMHPKITIHVTTDTPAVLFRMLTSNELDTVYLVDEELKDPKWIKVLNTDEDVVFAISASHPMANQIPLSLSSLLALPFILTEKDASYRRVLDYKLQNQDLRINPIFETNNTDLILKLIKDGLGVSFLPEYALKKDLDDKTLMEFQIPSLAVTIKRQVIYHKDKWVTKEMRAFFDYLLSLETNK